MPELYIILFLVILLEVHFNKRLEVLKMKCKLCKKPASGILCNSCRDFLKWNYPNDDPEDVLQNYEKAYARNGLRGRKRK